MASPAVGPNVHRRQIKWCRWARIASRRSASASPAARDEAFIAHLPPLTSSSSVRGVNQAMAERSSDQQT